MADPFKHVSPGATLEIPARTWNDLVDLARAWKAGRLARPSPRGGDEPNPYCEVLVRNDTGGDLPRGSILRITDVLVSPVDLEYDAQRLPTFSANVPTSTGDAVLVTLEAIPEDAFGRAVLSGHAVCDVEVQDSAHLYAIPRVSDSTKLDTAASGSIRILWREAGSSGTKRACVLLGCTIPPFERVELEVLTDVTAAATCNEDGTITIDLTKTYETRTFFVAP